MHQGIIFTRKIKIKYTVAALAKDKVPNDLKEALFSPTIFSLY